MLANTWKLYQGCKLKKVYTNEKKDVAVKIESAEP